MASSSRPVAVWLLLLLSCLGFAVAAVQAAMASGGSPWWIASGALSTVLLMAAGVLAWRRPPAGAGQRPTVGAVVPVAPTPGSHPTVEAPQSPAQSDDWRQPDQLASTNELLTTLSRVQAQFISTPDADVVFGGLLDDLLVLTDSAFGFIGEVLTPPEGAAFVEYRAARGIAWTPNDDPSTGATYGELIPLVNQVIASERPLVADVLGPPGESQRGCGFAGLPLARGTRLVGLVGLGGRPGGYEPAVLEFLQPAIASTTTLLEAVKASAERRAADERVRVSEERYRDLLDHASDLVHSVRPDGSFAYVNRAWLDTLRYREADVPRLSIWQVADGSSHEAYRNLLAGAAGPHAPALAEVRRAAASALAEVLQLPEPEWVPAERAWREAGFEPGADRVTHPQDSPAGRTR
jgi:PAS domain-containing protein